MASGGLAVELAGLGVGNLFVFLHLDKGFVIGIPYAGAVEIER